MPFTKKESLFSLVEMLIVVVVGMVILSFLFPALRNVMEKGRMNTCLLNLRQVYTLHLTYSDDFHGRSPPIYTDHFNEGAYNSTWVNLLGFYYVDSSWPKRGGNCKSMNLSPYLCPNQPMTSKLHFSVDLEFHFAANARGTGPFELYPDQYPTAAKPLAAVAPDTIMYTESQSKHTPAFYEDHAPSQTPITIGTNSVQVNWERHLAPGANFIFADSSARHYDWGILLKHQITRWDN